MNARRFACLAVLVALSGACRYPPPDDAKASGGHGNDHGKDNKKHAKKVKRKKSEAAVDRRSTAEELHGDPLAGIDFPPPFDRPALHVDKRKSGLVVEDFAVGEGPSAKAGDEIAVHYTGYLLSGDTFDSSLSRGRPFTLKLGKGRVIKGWEQGLVGMKAGGRRRLTIPAKLGYGSRAAGKIPPNSTLAFTVELVRIEPPPPPPKGDEAYQGDPLRKEERDGGLIVEIYAEGSGDSAKSGDEVIVHYTGTLDDGTVFDRSIDRDPIRIPLGRGRVIKGWDMGLDGMKVGELRRLIIPAALGYGERARGKIPANARLTFTVELMGLRSQ
ncbi:MAG: FKBP-type peptidyl-prolyl cis-trans isomerase [Myxococcales bacterium FL481]|nr:MAG: FKBP-type peptidyl-prolyl cis-trans isomerase [Myxococcales bacterium FL481]